jgi:hypothetical protein
VSNIIQLRRRPRPLRKTYSATAPYEVERQDEDDGAITYLVADMRPESYRTVSYTTDMAGVNPYAKHDAEQIARGLNMLVQYGMEKLPNVRDRDDGMPHFADEDEDDDGSF